MRWFSSELREGLWFPVPLALVALTLSRAISARSPKYYYFDPNVASYQHCCWGCTGPETGDPNICSQCSEYCQDVSKADDPSVWRPLVATCILNDVKVDKARFIYLCKSQIDLRRSTIPSLSSHPKLTKPFPSSTSPLPTRNSTSKSISITEGSFDSSSRSKTSVVPVENLGEDMLSIVAIILAVLAICVSIVVGVCVCRRIRVMNSAKGVYMNGNNSRESGKGLESVRILCSSLEQIKLDPHT